MGSEFPQQAQGERRPHPILDEVTGMKERLWRMESFIQQAAALAVTQAQRADEIKQSFEATVAALEAQLRERWSALDKDGSSLEGQDQELTSRIRDLESQLREKEQQLEIRNAELDDLRAKLEETAALAMEPKQDREIQEGFETAVAALKAQLREKEELLNQKDIALKDMEESLTGLEESLVNQVRVLEGQLGEMILKKQALPELSWEEINEAGAYVEKGSGDLYRIPQEALSPGSSPIIQKQSSGASRFVQVSKNPFVTTLKARMICAEHNLEPNF